MSIWPDITDDDVAALRSLHARVVGTKLWHAGRSVGRTLYEGNGGAEDLLGIVNTPEQAELIVRGINALPVLLDVAHWALTPRAYPALIVAPHESDELLPAPDVW